MKQFLAGYLFCWAIQSLYADSLGKEKFAKWATENWIDSSTTVPLACLAIMFAIYTMIK